MRITRCDRPVARTAPKRLVPALVTWVALTVFGSAPAAASFVDLRAPLEQLQPPACTINWDGGAGTASWHDAANWDLDRLPRPTDDVCVRGALAGVTHAAGVTSEILHMHADSTVTVSGGTLRMTDATVASELDTLRISGGIVEVGGGGAQVESVEHFAGELGGPGVVAVTQGYQWSGGRQSGSGGITIIGAASAGIGLTGPADKQLAGRAVQNFGGSLWSGGDLELSGDAAFDNRGALAVEGTHVMKASTGGGSLINAGSLEVKSGALLDVRVPFSTDSGAQVRVDGALGLHAGGTHLGAFTAGVGGLLAFREGTHTLGTGASIDATGATVDVRSGSVSVAAGLKAKTVNVAAGGKFTLGGATAIDTLHLADGSITFDGNAELGTVEHTGGDLGGSGTATVTVAYRWSGGRQTGTGATKIAAGSTGMRLSGLGTKTVEGRTLFNDSGSTWTAGDLELSGSALLENTGGLKVHGAVRLKAGLGNPTAVTLGTLEVTAEGALVADVDFNTTESALVKLAGPLALAGGGQQHGEFDLAPTGFLSFRGGTQRFFDGSAINAADATPGVEVRAGTVAVEGTYDAKKTTVVDGTLRFSKDVTLDTLDLHGGKADFVDQSTIELVEHTDGELGGSGDVTVTQGYDWTGGIQRGSGTTIIGKDSSGIGLHGPAGKELAGRELLIRGGSAWDDGDLTLSGGAVLYNVGALDVAGFLTVRQGAGGGAVKTSGTLEVPAGSSLKVEPRFRTDPGAALELGGELVLAGGGGHSGRFTLGPGARLALGVEHEFFAESAVAGMATGANVDVDSGTTTLGGTFEARRTTVGPDGALEVRKQATSTAVRNEGGAVTLGDDAKLAVGESGYTQTAGTTTLRQSSHLEMPPAPSEAVVDIQGGVLEGVGTIAGPVRNAGTVAPGLSTGILRIAHDFRQTDAGKLRLEVRGPVPGSAFDQLAIIGTATLSGELEVDAPEGFTPPEDGLQLLRAGLRVGKFRSFRATASYDLEYRSTGVVLVPAAACPQLRGAGRSLASPASPTLRDTLNLSRTPERSMFPGIARAEGGMVTSWFEEGTLGGIQHRVEFDDGGFSEPRRGITIGDGTFRVLGWDVAASGRHVYDVWEERADGQHEVMVAASEDGGRSFPRALQVSRTPGKPSWSPLLAASGPRVSVVWSEWADDALVLAQSADGGETFPDDMRGRVGTTFGSDYGVAQSGPDAYVVWRDPHREGLFFFRSSDRTSQQVPGIGAGALSPSIVATGDDVHILWAQRVPQGERSFIWEEMLASSHDRGSTWNVRSVGRSRLCGPTDVGCGTGHVLAASGSDVVVAWLDSFGRQAHVQAVTSEDRGASFGSAVEVAPAPRPNSLSVAVSEGRIYLAWAAQSGATAPPLANPLTPLGNFRAMSEVTLATSADGGRSFNLAGGRDFDLDRCGLQHSLFPEVAADGDSFAVTWTNTPADEPFFGNMEVGYRSGVLAEPDLALQEAAPVQAPQDAERLVAGKPTVIRAKIRNTLPVSRPRVTVRLRYAHGTGSEVVKDEAIVLTGVSNEIFLPLNEPLRPDPGELRFSVQLDPDDRVRETTEDNNAKDGIRKVKDTYGLRVLVVPIRVKGEATLSCDSAIRGFAREAHRYISAAFPLDPRETSFEPRCHPIEMDDVELDDQGILDRLLGPLERATWGTDYDKTIGVVRSGWFKDHTTSRKGSVALAPYGSDFDAAIVEQHATGGWAAAHEISHQMGWVTSPDHHQSGVTAPGFWVEERSRFAPTIKDWMHPSQEGSDLANPRERWIATNTWDYLLSKFAADPVDPPVIALSGVVKPDGSVQAEPWFELDGVVDAPLGSSGELGVRYIDGSGGVLASAGFDATHELASQDGAGGRLPGAAFAVRIPQVEGTRKILLMRGDEVLYERVRTAHAPTVDVTAPAGGEFRPGKTMTVSWSSSDADGDSLAHLLALSTDGGQTWSSLAEGVAGSSFTFTLPRHLLAEKALIRITASDGLNTTSAQSPEFAIRHEGNNGKIAFSRCDDISSCVQPRIWTMEPDGSRQTQLSECTARAPGWSPDGGMLAFYGVCPGGPGGLWAMRADGSGAHPILENSLDFGFVPSSAAVQGPRWSPDGRRLVFMLGDGGGVIATVNADGSNRALVPRPDEFNDEHHPDWSPDGSSIAFFRTGIDGDSIWAMNPDGSGRQMLRPALATSGLAWSPDGEQIAFTDGLNPDGLSVMEADGTGLRTLVPGCWWGSYDDTEPAPTPGGVCIGAYFPAWSPDGSSIVFSRGRGTNARDLDLWVVNADGSGLRRLTNTTTEDEWTSSWQRLRAPEPPPELSADAGGPYVGDEGQPVQLEASGSEPTAQIDAYEWDLDGDGQYDDAAGAVAEETFEDDGTFTLAIRVRAESGALDADTATVTVSNLPPEIVDANAAVDHRLDAVLTSMVTDAGSDDLEATVDWGDGSPREPLTVVSQEGGAHVLGSHHYRAGSSFPITLSVSDGDGGAASKTIHLEGPPPNRQPVAEGQEAETGIEQPVALTVAGFDPDGDSIGIDVADPPDHGTVEPLPETFAVPGVEPNFVYTPEPGFEGEDSFVVTATDGLLKSEPATVKIQVGRLQPPPDDAPPTTTIALSPAEPDGLAGWYVSKVHATVSAVDDASGSGVAETRCVLDPETPPASFDATPAGCAFMATGDDVAVDGVHTLYAASRDAAGNEETVISRTFKLDRTPPTVSCSAAPSTFRLNEAGASITAIVTDVTSGPAATTPPAAADTASVGAKAAAVVGVDRAGNTATASCPYLVTYAFVGFFPPVDNLDADGDPILNVVNAGQAIPLKWRLTDANGVGVTNLSDVEVTVTTLPCSLGSTVDQLEERAAGASGLQNHGAGYYQFNWKSPKGYARSCKRLRVNLFEGSTTSPVYHVADFKFTR
jgi:Tol biopolymer transport system component